MITLTENQLKGIAKDFKRLCQDESGTILVQSELKDLTAYGYVDVISESEEISHSINGCTESEGCFGSTYCKLTEFWLLDESETQIDVVNYDYIVKRINQML
jgi:Ca2+-binding EF-hand superfamily protein